MFVDVSEFLDQQRQLAQAGLSLAPENMIRLAGQRMRQCWGVDEIFCYQPLPDSKSWMRLLVLSPGEQDSPLTGKLIQAPANEAKKSISYEALSYYWGPVASVDNVRLIDLEDGMLPISLNVFDALVQLRKRDAPQYLWIDAVCINQLDLEERSHQVQLMSLIYRSALRTVVWLGQADETSDLAITLIRDWKVCKQKSHGGIDIGIEERNALTNLVNREWFSRTWCLQEIALSAGDPLIMCGASYFNLQCLVEFTQPDEANIQIVRHESNFGAARDRIVYHTMDYLRARDRLRDPEPLFLEDILMNTGRLQCSNSFDKVYAILGLVSGPSELAPIIPDYTKELPTVYLEAMNHCLESRHSLNLLCFNTNSTLPVSGTEGPHIGPTTMLPSWVSDWRLGSLRPEPLIKRALYGCCGVLGRIYPPPAPEYLFVNRIHIDTIVDFSRRLPRCDNSDTCFAIIRQAFEFLSSHFNRLKSHSNIASDPELRRRILSLQPDPRDSDFCWRTLIGDAFWYGAADPVIFPAPNRLAEMFEAMVFGQSREDRNVSVSSPLPEGFTQEDLPTGRLQTPTASRLPDDFLPEEQDQGERWNQYVAPYLMRMDFLQGRQFFVTETGYMGLGGAFEEARGEVLRKGDQVVILLGGNAPFILRERQKGDRKFTEEYQLVSEAYVHGVMRTEFFLNLINKGQEQVSAAVRSILIR